jgi:hypothetical protein
MGGDGADRIAVRRLLERGDEVTALARDPTAITAKHERFTCAKRSSSSSASSRSSS